MLKNIIVNTLIYFTEMEKTMRILWVDRDSTIVFVIDIYANIYKPVALTVAEIMEDLHNNKAKILEADPWARIVFEDEIKENHKKRRDRAWAAVSYVLDSCGEPEIYDPSTRASYIREASKKFGIGRRSIYEYLKRYWQRGLTKNALLPDYGNCGGRGKTKTIGNIKKGRPRKNYFSEGVNVDENIRETFRISLKRFYYTTTQNSLRTAYELMIKEYFSEGYRYDDSVKKPIILDDDKIPSFGQFRYWFEKERDIQKEVSSRTSSKRYFLENRAILGDSTQEAQGPGSIYQIDATIADVYLVSRYNKNHIIGRPIVYAVVDVFSRMITGLYIGLEGPSWLGAMMALANTTMDKVKFCKEYGIDISPIEWPVNYLPETIVADRGELEGKNIENLIGGLGIKVSNTASYRGDMKAIVERYFRTINTKIKPFTPGFVGGDFARRGGKDYRLDAKLDIYQFTQLIIKCVLYHNNYHYMCTYSREKMMVEDNIDPIPSNIWNWGIANRAGRLRYVDEEIVKLHLMPRAKARITGRGISFKGVLYGSEKALKDRWFEIARNRGSWKVKISYDPRSMDYIYIINDDNCGYEKCFLLNHEERYTGKTLEEVEYLLQYERMREIENENRQLQAKVDLMADIEAIVEGAKQDKAGNSGIGLSDTSRLKEIASNRNMEKILNRESEYLELGRNEIPKGGKVVYMNNEEDDFVDDFELFRQIQKERLDDEQNSDKVRRIGRDCKL